jgi:hypothetical protein
VVLGGGPHSGRGKRIYGRAFATRILNPSTKGEKMANPRIIDLVRSKRDANVAAGQAEDHEPAKRTGELAVAAVIGGIQSTAWELYMAHFGESTPFSSGQLERMCATDQTTGNVTLDEKRAYLVANGICGMASPDTRNLDFEVDSIDDGLAACDRDNGRG